MDGETLILGDLMSALRSHSVCYCVDYSDSLVILIVGIRMHCSVFISYFG